MQKSVIGHVLIKAFFDFLIVVLLYLAVVQNFLQALVSIAERIPIRRLQKLNSTFEKGLWPFFVSLAVRASIVWYGWMSDICEFVHRP